MFIMDNKVIKSSIWYTISSFLVSGITIISTPIFSRILSLDEYGAFSNFTAIYSVLSVAITLNFHSTLIRAKYDLSNHFDQYISSLLYIIILIISFLTVLANIFYDFINEFIFLSRLELNIMMISLLFYPIINIFQAWQRINYNYKVSVLISFVSAFGNILISLILVFLLNDKLFGRIVGSQLPTIIIGFFLMIYFFKKSRKFNFSYCAYALKICLPFIPHLLAMNLLSMLDKMMITSMCGTEYNALYSIAVNCGLIMSIVISALNGSFAPWMGEQLHKKNYKRIKNISYSYILLFFVVGVGNLLFAPEILMIFGGTKYISAKYLIPPIILGCMCQMLYTLYVNIEQFEKKTIGMAIASCSAAVINFITNAIFIPKFGYEAAAYTTFFSYFCLLVAHYFLVKKMKLHIVFNTKYILLILLCLIALSGLIIILYNYNFLRYILCSIYITLILYFCIKNFSYLKKLFK